MNFMLEVKIARRYLRAKKCDSFIAFISGFSFIGIIIGVAALIIVMSVLGGYKDELLRLILGFGGHVHAHVRTYTTHHNTDPVHEIRMIMQQNQINYDNIFGFIEGNAMAVAINTGQFQYRPSSANVGVVVRAVTDDYLQNKRVIFDNIQHGTLTTITNHDIVVGVALANKLNLHVGDKLRVVFGAGKVSVVGMIPKFKDFTISAIFASGMHLYDATHVFINYNIGAKIFVHDDQATSLPHQFSDIEITLHNPENAKQVAVVMNRHIPKMRFTSWQQSNYEIINALEIEKVVMRLILCMIIVVAAFNIVSSLTMIVSSKMKDIAILRTMGLTRLSIIRIFMLCGAFLGIYGAVIGGAVGTIIALNTENIRQCLEQWTGVTIFDPIIYYLSMLPSKVVFGEVMCIVISAICISILAALYPAHRASKVQPAVALRYE